MTRALAVIALLMGTASAGAETRSPGDTAGGDWRPVLGAKPSSPDRPPLSRGVRGAGGPVWSADVEYRHVIDRPDLVARGKRGDDISRPGFATLRRSFGAGEFRPYVGMGIGAASTQFADATPDTEDALAVKAVVGGKLRFTEKVGGYVQYDYAVRGESEMDRQDRKAHGIRFGLSIALN